MDHFEDRWWRPDELLAAAQAIMRATPDDEFFCDSAYQPVREAIAASWFAERRPWDRDWEVRPVPRRERFPDAQLCCCEDDIRDFEIVEADLREGRRCEVYRRAKGLPPTMTLYEPTSTATALDEIARVIGLKAEKGYSPRPNLLVYVNLNEGEPTSLDAWSLHDIYGPRFVSAWLLWQGGTFRLWPNPAKIKRPA